MQHEQYEVPPPGPWIREFPKHYIAELEAIAEDATRGWFTPEHAAVGWDGYIKANLAYGRLEQCQTTVMPWLRAAVPDLSGLTVLEVGCGTGIATVPIALASHRVVAFDIDARSLAAARRRCALFGISNVELLHRDKTWIDAYADDPRSVTPEPVDLIFCYALLEHLTPPERLTFLAGAWRHLRPGGHLVIVECPNRLSSFDWHTGKQPFSDWLPDDLLMTWYGRYSSAPVNPVVRAPSIAAATAMGPELLYRNGRGVSFHEFELSIGLKNLRVTAGSTADWPLNRGVYPGADPAWEEAVATKLAAMEPPVPREFARQCLDLVLTKVT